MPEKKSVNSDLTQSIAAIEFSQGEISKKTRMIYEKVIERSKCINEGNFTQISTEDLNSLFDRYDGEFFSGMLRTLLAREKGGRLIFTLSKRMTKAGGKTKVFTKKIKVGKETREETIYEISIATTLLFQTFLDVERTIRVNGIVCRDRLEALQRVFEHELIHLLELLVWKKSSCSASNFKRLAKRIFAHTTTTHHLVTQPERARTKYDIKIGDKVEFIYKNVKYSGIVNRITKRATILVEHEDGELYSDKKRYLKFYIPLSVLTKRK